MKFDIFMNEKSNIASENRLLKFFVVVIGIAVLMSSIYSYHALRYQKVIIIPPGARDNIEVMGNIVNDEYVKAFTRYIVSLAFNYSPATVRKQYDELLALFDSGSYPQGKTTFYNYADNVEITQTSSTFYIDKIWMDKKKKWIEVGGIERHYMDDRKVKDGAKVYLVGYTISDGRFRITGISEKHKKGNRDED
ncbi:MAG: type IV conjugative transfer system protein TraE [Syntrophales bacterium]|nr:type IV conjugative transfer system protein TraE [Syntrophales bacterium]